MIFANIFQYAIIIPIVLTVFIGADIAMMILFLQVVWLHDPPPPSTHPLFKVYNVQW